MLEAARLILFEVGWVRSHAFSARERQLGSDGEGAWMLLGEGEEEDEAEGGEEADDLQLDEHAVSLPLVQPARLNLYTPQINLEVRRQGREGYTA